MTYGKLAIGAAASVYDRCTLPDCRYTWTGEVDNIQFDVLRHKPTHTVVVAFAGSNELMDWRRHLLVRRERLTGFKGLVHRGWLADWRKCRSTVFGAVEQVMGPDDMLLLCGHSYGGSLAQLAALAFAMRVPVEQIYLYTFGCPRVGNKAYAETLDSLIFYHFRYTIATDPVPQLPFGIRYKHAGRHQKLGRGWPGHSITTYQEMVK